MNRHLEESTQALKIPFQRYFGKTPFARTFFWSLITSILLFSTLQACIINSSPLTAFLAFLLPIGSFLCLKYKTWGLLTSYIVLGTLFAFYFPSFAKEEKLWQIGLTLSSAIGFFIVRLAQKETAFIFEDLHSQAVTYQNQIKNGEFELDKLKKNQEKERQEFEDEIKRLKDEAEVQKAEKSIYERKFELIHSEILFLNEQKNKFIEETALARKEKIEAEQLAEQVKGKNEELVRENRLLEERHLNGQAALTKDQDKNKLLENEVLSLQEKLVFYQNACLVAEQKLEETVKKDSAQIENLEALRKQISEFQKALLEKESEKASLVKASEDNERKSALQQEELQVLNKEISSLQQILKGEEEQKVSLSKQLEEKEAYMSFLKEQSAVLQDKILSFQNLALTIKASSSEEIEKEKKDAERLFKQLRSQFDEKTRVLAETRKELFQAQTKLFAFEKEKNEESMSSNWEMRPFEDSIASLNCQIQELEEEITRLEQLVSRILLP